MAAHAARGHELLLVMPPGQPRDSLVEGLRSRYGVTVADTAEEATAKATRLLPDAVLLWRGLAPMERWHGLKQLHEHASTREIPVLGFGDEASQPSGLASLAASVAAALARRAGGHPDDQQGLGDINLAPTDLPAPVRTSAPSVPPRPVHIRRKGGEERPVAARDPLDTGRILVVDDEELNRDVLGRRLVRKGYQVASAESGAQALDMLAAGGHDVMVLDWMMPGLSGIDVLRKVRERWSQLQLPVIMATARSDTEDVVQALAHGANDYVTKPLNFDVVHARLRTQVGLVLLNRELRASEERYRALLENTGDLILQHRPGGRLTYVSPAARLLLGYEPEELLGQSLTHWLYPADRRALEANPAGWANPPPAFTYLARWRRKDGIYIWIETSCRVVGSGEDRLIQAACRDVSQHMSRLPGDEPPLPLGGDIMAHPGWRAG